MNIAEKRLMNEVSILGSRGVFDDHEGWLFDDRSMPQMQDVVRRAAALLAAQGEDRTCPAIRKLLSDVDASGDAGIQHANILGTNLLEASYGVDRKEFEITPEEIQKEIACGATKLRAPLQVSPPLRFKRS